MTAHMNDAPIILSIANGVAEIRFNRPDVLNAIDLVTARRFSEVVSEVVQNTDVRAIILSGEGRAFIAGGDLGYFQDAEDVAAAADVLIETLHTTLLRLVQNPRPVIASLKGPVAGGGLGIALAADLAIAAQDVRISMAYLSIAASPDCASSWNLVHMLGLRKAMELALVGGVVDAPEALRLGLVNRLVPRADLDAETHALAAHLASHSLPALGRTKALLRNAATSTLPQQMQAEQKAFVAGCGTFDFNESIDAFLSKRKPVLRHC